MIERSDRFLNLKYEDTTKVDLTFFLTKLHDLSDFEIGELDNLVRNFCHRDIQEELKF